ncbi:MAG: ribosome assembly RNA-binding protein YhbY [Desulfobacter postgatei]|uniref:Ribosome assembly RNA-binding protein YhbY n=1 Tax=Desulfobacter postgatei TaxID=2293 RepID=A0A2G6MQI9_9BACT|nr:MAG: ribosome assembly RNA-binding protein YhbY [Desulfobacter postgatei]
MTQLTGAQRKYLRGLAHHLNPSAFVGVKGVTTALIQEMDKALNASELIKIKFIDHKEKALKAVLLEEITARLKCHVAGSIGHVAVLYRCHPDPEKRKITLD